MNPNEKYPLKQILVLHGPNLNQLGQREPEKYGSKTLAMVNAELLDLAKQHSITLDIQQHQSEAALIEAIHYAGQASFDAIIFNPAGYTHTSIVLRDALLTVALPFVEVHISNLAQREPFRHHSFFSDIASGVIQGCGTYGYTLALLYIIHQLT